MASPNFGETSEKLLVRVFFGIFLVQLWEDKRFAYLIAGFMPSIFKYDGPPLISAFLTDFDRDKNLCSRFIGIRDEEMNGGHGQNNVWPSWHDHYE